MKILRFTSTVFILLLVVGVAIANVKVKQEWSDEDFAGHEKFDKIAVYVAASVSMRRQGFESSIARHLRSKGINAFPSYILPNLSGRKLDLEKVLTAFDNEGVDAVLTIYVTSVGGGKEMEKYVRPSWGLDISNDWAHPYADVYTISSGSYDYTATQQQFYLETRLVDFSSRKPVWLMFTKTTDPEYRNTNKEFIKLLTKKLKHTDFIQIK